MIKENGISCFGCHFIRVLFLNFTKTEIVFCVESLQESHAETLHECCVEALQESGFESLH